MITKALSIRAPWWWFILHGGKDIENREWPTKLRGRVYLHASKWYVHSDVIDDLLAADHMIPGLKERREEATKLMHPHHFLRRCGGAIVGSIEIVDCVEKSDSPWFFGAYGFVLQNPVAFERPVLCKGALGFFTPPDDVLAELRKRGSIR